MNTDQHRPRQVLIADDNEVDRRALARACVRLGWQVESVASGGELIGVVKVALGRGVLPDCLLVDWHMPHLDGLAAVNELTTNLTESETPAVVLVTALDAAMVSLAESELGDYLILHKPINTDDLLAVVDAAVGSSAANLHSDSSRANRGQRLPDQHNANPGWPNLCCVDATLARANVGDDIEFYEELCEAFISPAYEMIHRVERLSASDDRIELRQYVHKLRGQLGTMGARELQEKAGLIESAIVDGFTYQVELEKLLACVRALLIDMEEWVRKVK